jgi:hypothetical protein
MTVLEAARTLHISEETVNQQLTAGALKGYYLDEHIEVQLVTRWEYERCPLWGYAGICIDYERRIQK